MIDCIPDKNKYLGMDLKTICNSRKCCWNDSPTNGGPNCVNQYNYGFRQAKIKENSFTKKWYELLRINSADSYTKSDISNLETKIEMQTDNRLRLRVIFHDFFIFVNHYFDKI